MKYTVTNITGDNDLTRTKTIYVVKRGQYIALAPGESTVLKEWEANKIAGSIATNDPEPKTWDRHTLALLEIYSVNPVTEEESVGVTEILLPESQETSQETAQEDEDSNDNESLGYKDSNDSENLGDDLEDDNENPEDTENVPDTIDLELIESFRTKREFIEFLEDNGYGRFGSMDKTLKIMKQELSEYLGL